MTTEFERAVLDGILLLRALRSAPGREYEAHDQLSALRKAYPGLRIDLVSDRSGDPEHVDRDLLIGDEVHGTVALSDVPATCSPWACGHAEHWAAMRVLTVDGQPFSIHDALRFWQDRAARAPTAMDELLDQALLAPALAQEEIEPGLDQLQRAADALRRRLGLHDRTATMRWLGQHGLDVTGFDAMVRRQLRFERWADGLFAADGSQYFEKHREEFVRIGVCRAHGSPALLKEMHDLAASGTSLPSLLEQLVVAARPEAVDGCIELRYAWQLPAPLRNAGILDLVGPWQTDGRLCLGQVLSRFASEFDAETQRAVRTRLVVRWLDHARATADIRWHWL